MAGGPSSTSLLEGCDERCDELRINQKFAKSFQTREEKRLLAKEIALGIELPDDDSSDHTSEDEEAKELTPELNLKIVRTINAIRGKDSQVYEPDKVFFEDNKLPVEKRTNETRATFKDVARRQIQEAAQNGEWRENNEELPSMLAYDEEQRELREELMKAGDDQDFALTRKQQVSHPEEPDRELHAELEKLKASGDKADNYLAEMTAKRAWREQSSSGVVWFEDDDMDGADEKFEAEYNFRFENEASSEIATYRRDVVGSLRRKDERRILKRASKKKRLEIARQEKLADLRRLRKLKAKIQAEQLATIAKESGMDFELEMLESDFDPTTYDNDMAAKFSDDWYAQRQEAKPRFDDGDHLLEEAPLKVNKASVFKYCQVEPNDFGLSTEEILETDDADLKQLVPIKRIAPYRDTEFKVDARKRRKWRQQLSNKVNRELAPPPAAAVQPTAKQSTNRQRLRIKSAFGGSRSDVAEGKKIGDGKLAASSTRISRGRLKSYGLA